MTNEQIIDIIDWLLLDLNEAESILRYKDLSSLNSALEYLDMVIDEARAKLKTPDYKPNCRPFFPKYVKE